MSRIVLFFVIGMFFFLEINAQNTAITDDDAYDPHPSAILDVKSINKGLLMPRLTTAQRNAVFNPATGLLVFDTDEKAFYFYDGGQWLDVSSGDSNNMWSKNGTTIQLSDNLNKVGVGTSTPIAKLGIKGEATVNDDQPLFDVVNASGDTIFAVYSTGVRINVYDGLTKATGKRGGFAVAGFDLSKGPTREYMRVTPDSIRMYVDKEATKTTGKRGGFAVAGFDLSKGKSQEYLRVTPDSVRVYIDNVTKATGKRGGFAVAGFDLQKGNDTSYLFVGQDTTQISTVFRSAKDMVINTDIFKSTGDYYVPDELATISTGFVSNIGADTAIAWGNVTSDGRSDVTDRGICWSINPNPTVVDNVISSGSGIGEFTSKLTALALNTIYYVRAYATNSIGTAYGNEVQFNSSATLPTIVTNPMVNITATTATAGGDVTNDGGAAVINRGVCWSTSETPTVSDNVVTAGSGIGSFTSQLTGLMLDSTYYVRAYATNSAGIAYGNQVQFTTIMTAPVITTISISNITDSTATGGGNITSDGGSAVISRGVCWDINQNPTIDNDTIMLGEGIGAFQGSMTGLSRGTRYYVRAFAINNMDTAYGEQVSFITLGTKLVEVVNPTTGRIWMDRNLGATRVATSSTDEQAYGDLYQWGRGTDGHEKRTSGTTSSLSITDTPEHGDFILGIYSPFDWRSPQNDNLWQGVNGVNNPCPEGFRLPTESEWQAERLSWNSNNAAGAFASPLKLTIGGCRRSLNGSFSDVGSSGYYCSDNTIGTECRLLNIRSINDYSNMMSYQRAYGYSVRCIKE